MATSVTLIVNKENIEAKKQTELLNYCMATFLDLGFNGEITHYHSHLDIKVTKSGKHPIDILFQYHRTDIGFDLVTFISKLTFNYPKGQPMPSWFRSEHRFDSNVLELLDKLKEITKGEIEISK